VTDYYSLLLRAVTAPDAGDEQWRRQLYDRARQMLVTQLRNRQPPATQSQITSERLALDAAIARIESETEWTTGGGDDIADVRSIRTKHGPVSDTGRTNATKWIALAVVVGLIGAGGYALWSRHSAQPTPVAVKTEAPKTASSPAPAPVIKVATAKDGDLAAGVDGGANDPDQAYWLRRQPTFYRTLQPAGTIIVDKLQHFLYLIQPNNVAMRYGVGIGGECTELAGLRHIAGMAEWPQWQATQDMIERKLAKPGVVPGTPGNPLGARVLQLDDGKSRINGTNAPKTIGSTVIFGCIHLVDDDVVDLYNRVKSGTSVLVN
jgi:lipoprotein-anchoring transpeptidase ErfK/SrfK